MCKINIDSDLRLAMTGTIRQFMAEHPDKFDPREYLKPARAAIKEWSPTRSWTAGLRRQGVTGPTSPIPTRKGSAFALPFSLTRA